MLVADQTSIMHSMNSQAQLPRQIKIQSKSQSLAIYMTISKTLFAPLCPLGDYSNKRIFRD